MPLRHAIGSAGGGPSRGWRRTARPAGRGPKDGRSEPLGGGHGGVHWMGSRSTGEAHRPRGGLAIAGLRVLDVGAQSSRTGVRRGPRCRGRGSGSRGCDALAGRVPHTTARHAVARRMADTGASPWLMWVRHDRPCSRPVISVSNGVIEHGRQRPSQVLGLEPNNPTPRLHPVDHPCARSGPVLTSTAGSASTRSAGRLPRVRCPASLP